MRAFTLVFVALAVQVFHCGTAFARLGRKSSAVTRTTPSDHLLSDHVVASRQYHPRRSLLDVCAYIDTDAILHGDILGIPISDLADLKICLCLSALPLILDVDVQLKVLTNKYGQSLANAIVEALIDISPNNRHCTYPDHATQSCSSSDPCDFTCDSPYVKEGDECVCAPPNTMCNGVCGDFSSGCGSAVPRALVGRSDGYSYPRLTGAAAAQASCKSKETVCGVWGGSIHSFECIDTNRTLESCGGCIVPSPFSGAGSVPTGRDCTAIDGSDKVSCVAGRCVVETCNNGWVVTENGDSCTESHGHRLQSTTFKVVTQVMEYSRHNIRAAQLQDEVEQPHNEPKHEEPSNSKPEDFYTSAWY